MSTTIAASHHTLYTTDSGDRVYASSVARPFVVEVYSANVADRRFASVAAARRFLRGVLSSHVGYTFTFSQGGGRGVIIERRRSVA